MSATAEAAHHDSHHEIVFPEDPEFGHATPGKLGMWFFLLSDAFSFSGLLLAYGISRAASDHWRPEFMPHLGINFTAVMTFVLICSSVSMVMAHAACVEGDRQKTIQYLGLTILGGLFFLGGQVYEYQHLIHQGMILGDKLDGETYYATTFYMITGFHGAHVTTGVIYLIVMLINTMRGKYDGGKHNSIEIAGLFWHFVDLVWILVFTFVYLVPQG